MYTITTTRVDKELRVYAASQVLTAEQVLAGAYYPDTPSYLASHTRKGLGAATAGAVAGSSEAVAAEPAAAQTVAADPAAAEGSGRRRKLQDLPEGAVYEVVSEEDLQQPPYNLIGRLTFQEQQVVYGCTAEFVSPVDILTAAHCFSTNYNTMTFQPGQSGDDQPNFGT